MYPRLITFLLASGEGAYESASGVDGEHASNHDSLRKQHVGSRVPGLLNIGCHAGKIALLMLNAQGICLEVFLPV